MKRMGLSQAINGKCSDVFIIGNNGIIQKADANSGSYQGFDRNETADGHCPEKVIQIIAGSIQSFFKNTAGAGALFPDNNGFF